MPKISIIAAVADNYAIGNLNKLPWHLPADLKYFKQLTTGHPVIMGKHTFDNLPNGALPNRKNIVLTSVISEGITKGYVEANSLEEAIEICKNDEEVFIIGGVSVFKQAIDIADRMYITWVHENFKADAFFPEINFDEWEEICREDHPADDKNPYAYTFSVYERKKRK